ncbi:fungal-specific transcription factor domain-containing protein [Fusarium tricinctum]|uniref:Fungal-specific transcription factor domain-containing protein n=1 Tax=Fusarium tricinctum TaxID=61284 RepID=A0A8K0WCR6_9HYPO|nr:fungal-specific transcription factor domain-containing protein [Fusarium tricinctum]
MSPPRTPDWDTACEAADQNTSTTDRRDTAAKNDQDGAKKTDIVEGETASANAESWEERPTKKMKRGKYISRACVREEIHVDNASRNDSHASPLLQEADNKAVATQGQVPLEAKISNDNINREILARLEAVESHLRLMRPPTPDLSRPTHNHASVNGQLEPSTAKLQSALETDGQTFAGEITMTPTFEDESDRLDHDSAVSSAIRVDYSSPASSLHPPATSPSDVTGRKRGWFERILARHGVVTDQQQCKYHLQVYMDEVHPMYPVVHPPAVWDIFDEIWQHLGSSSSTESGQSEQFRVSVALIMYMFRLDANQKAARVHALAVSVAQTIGLHRQSTIDSMPAYYSQLYSRTWWSLYLLDRRLALESGKPYFIQDSNVDTSLPLDLSDEWMTRFASRKETIAELQVEVAAEIARDSSPSCVPYVLAMVRYCRVAGKTWEVLYGVKSSTASMSAMVEYVDTAIGKLLNTVPTCLQYDLDVSYETQFSSRTRWQVKQTFLFNNCCTYLRLLIRRPLLPSSSAIYHTEEDDLESSIECASLAARILTTHQNIKDDGLKYSFALSHYVTSCAIVMIGLVSRELGSKRRYRGLILAATQCLNGYCQKIWVSGKMMRCVSRLSRLVDRVLAVESPGSQDRQSPSNTRRDSVSVSERLAQHLTPPETENQDPMQYRVGISNMYNNQLKELGMDSSGSVQRDQREDYYSFNTDSLGTMAQRPTGSLNKLPTGWLAEPNPDPQDSWIMSDFNFETFGERFGPNDAELTTFVENDTLDFARGMGLTSDRGPSEARLGALGVNGVFDLDMDLVPTMMNLYAG